jgi:type 1 glutamine amidotransferase
MRDSEVEQMKAWMKRAGWPALLLAVAALGSSCQNGGSRKTAFGDPDQIDVVVVTGGHDFEHDPFFTLFQGHDDIRYVEATQEDDSELFEDLSTWAYDVVVLYNMTQNISPKRQDNFARLLRERGIGLVALHHAECAFQDWPEYRSIIGAKYPLTAQEIDGVSYEVGTYKHDMEIAVSVRDRRHPITRGMKDFRIHDEVYKGLWFAPGNHVLLTTNHPDSDTTIGWTRQYSNARVCCIQLGHDARAYANPEYRRLIARAIRWTAGKLK